MMAYTRNPSTQKTEAGRRGYRASEVSQDYMVSLSEIEGAGAQISL